MRWVAFGLALGTLLAVQSALLFVGPGAVIVAAITGWYQQ